MKKHIIQSIILLVLLQFGVQAQTKFEEGKITYTISYSDMDIDPQSASMLPTESVMYFKDNMSRIEMSMSMGSTIVIANGKTGEATTLMDMMGHKISMKMTKEDKEKMMKKNKEKVDIKIKYTEGSKKICGYNCNRAEITYDDEKNPLEVYYTTDITAYNPNFNDQYPELKGFPLQYTVSENEMTMKLTAKEIKSGSLDKSLFEVPPGYKETKPEDLHKMFGGQ